MKTSLSLILPVHNAEFTLERDISLLVELLPELTPEFEILIIDDGSVDETDCLARELAQCYPQIRTIRHPLRYGRYIASQIGIQHTTGEIVIIRDECSPIRASEITELWQLRNDQRLVMAQTRDQSSQDVSGQEIVRKGSLRMLRRRAVERLAEVREPEEYLQVQPFQRHDDSSSLTSRRPKYLIRMKPGVALP